MCPQRPISDHPLSLLGGVRVARTTLDLLEVLLCTSRRPAALYNEVEDNDDERSFK